MTYANNDSKSNKNYNITFSDKNASAPSARIDNLYYDLDKGTIKVTVVIDDAVPGKHYKVKVTPKSQVKGTVVEGSLYLDIWVDNDKYARSTKGEVVFHCYSGDASNAPYCRAYDFDATIVKIL